MRDDVVLRLLAGWELEGAVKWCDEVAPLLADRLEDMGHPLCGQVRRLLREHVLPMPCGKGAFLDELVLDLGDEDLEEGGIVVELCQVDPPEDRVILRGHMRSRFGSGHDLAPRPSVGLSGAAYLRFPRRPLGALGATVVWQTRHPSEVMRFMVMARIRPEALADRTALSIARALGAPAYERLNEGVWGAVHRL